MKRRKIILDSGPPVALLNKRDSYHEWAVAQFAQISPPLLTCEAVLSEACFLLRHLERGPDSVLQLVERGAVAIAFEAAPEVRSIRALLLQYRNIPMSFADACLVRMAEKLGDSAIHTLDRDFRIYRKHRRKTIATVMPGP